MKIAIDISQIVHEGTGVGKYVKEMVKNILNIDTTNQFILFGYSLRKLRVLKSYLSTIELAYKNVTIKLLPLPPTVFEMLWNRLHIIPVEWFIGNVDIFWSSDWIQPPLQKAIGVTTIHDLTIYRYPESFPKEIVDVHKRRLNWVDKECSVIFCDSEATKKDVQHILHVPSEKLYVVYPGYK